MRILACKGRRVKGKWKTACEPLTTSSKDSWDVVLDPIILLVFLTLVSWLTKELSLRMFGMCEEKFFIAWGGDFLFPDFHTLNSGVDQSESIPSLLSVRISLTLCCYR